jgi:hypothetical protein
MRYWNARQYAADGAFHNIQCLGRFPGFSGAMGIVDCGSDSFARHVTASRRLLALFRFLFFVFRDAASRWRPCLGREKCRWLPNCFIRESFSLRAGLADLSVFIQQEGKSAPVLDAVVNFRLNKISRPSPELAWRGPGCVSPGQDVLAVQGHSGNGLLYSALVGIPEPGLWDLGIWISRMGVLTPASFTLQVDRMESPAIRWWPLVGIVPAAIGLYALRDVGALV